MIVIGQRPNAVAELMNELVVAGTERDEIGWGVGPSSGNALNVMNMQPSLVRAAVALSVDESTTPAIASIDGVEFASREGLALRVRRISRPRARFCAHEF